MFVAAGAETTACYLPQLRKVRLWSGEDPPLDLEVPRDALSHLGSAGGVIWATAQRKDGEWRTGVFVLDMVWIEFRHYVDGHGDSYPIEGLNTDLDVLPGTLRFAICFGENLVITSDERDSSLVGSLARYVSKAIQCPPPRQVVATTFSDSARIHRATRILWLDHRTILIADNLGRVRRVFLDEKFRLEAVGHPIDLGMEVSDLHRFAKNYVLAVGGEAHRDLVLHGPTLRVVASLAGGVLKASSETSLHLAFQRSGELFVVEAPELGGPPSAKGSALKQALNRVGFAMLSVSGRTVDEFELRRDFGNDAFSYASGEQLISPEGDGMRLTWEGWLASDLAPEAHAAAADLLKLACDRLRANPPGGDVALAEISATTSTTAPTAFLASLAKECLGARYDAAQDRLILPVDAQERLAMLEAVNLDDWLRRRAAART
jgi:hypothetical protein